MDTVCKRCNEGFSKFESDWCHSAIEAMMRNFSGPLGRRGNSEMRRQQPIECDHVFIVERNDELVYEAGFAFPNHHYFRPQIVQADGGLIGLATDRTDGELLAAAIDELRNGPLDVSGDVAREWLADAHAGQDSVVAGAYDWDGEVSKEEALKELLRFNSTRYMAQDSGS